jgi:branched-subunit amino acid aminotransferase/4-amino-4-deoxychorismate lyase
MDDRGYQFGDGVYEVVRLYEGEFFLMDPHLERLGRSCREMGLSLGVSLQVLKERLVALAKRELVQTGTVYIQVTRGVYSGIQEFPTWSDAAAYDRQARHLAKLFAENIKHYQNPPAAMALTGVGL